MELWTTLDMIRYYFTKSLQEYQFRCFHNIILGIHEDDIHSYNASRVSLLEQVNIILEREKEHTHKSSKNCKQLRQLRIVLGRIIEWTTNARLPRAISNAQDKYYKPYTHIMHVYIMVSIDKFPHMLKTLVIYLYKCQNICNMIV